MKILPSSPYAVFNAKEWESIINRQNRIDKDNKCNIQKYYYKNFKKYNVKNSSQYEIKKNKLIQLSFD